MGLKRVFKLVFWNRLLQVRCQMAFRLRALKNGGLIEKGIYAYKMEHVSIGRGVRIKRNWRVECYPKFCHQILKPKMTIGDNVIINFGFTAFVADEIEIGSNCIFAANVTLISENHGMDPEAELPFHAQPLTTGPISIGEGCWIGQNVSILPNVSIGKKCIIATNSVVTKNIPDYSIAVGIPAKVLKQYNFVNHKWESIHQ